MFFLRDIVSRFGFSNTLSVVSFIISITCFAFVARVSQKYSKLELNKIEPKVILANNETVKIAVDKTNYDVDSTVYDNIVSNIDTVSESSDETNPIVKAKKIPLKTIEKNVEPEKINNPISENVIKKDVEKQGIKNKKNIQLGIFKSHREAVSAWFKMSDQSDYLSNLRYNIVSKETTNKQYLYLLQIKTKDYQEAEKISKILAENGITTNIVE